MPAASSWFFLFRFAITVLAAFTIPFLPGRDTKATWETVKEILSCSLSPSGDGIAGSVLGFYFGSKANTLVAENETHYTAPGHRPASSVESCKGWI